ncbi:MAG: WD40 repeat domain-containing protein [Deltaproteobacteria bacterium]
MLLCARNSGFIFRRTAFFVASASLLAALTTLSRADDPQVPPNFALQKTLDGHKNKVWCVAFSPDGKFLASGSGGFVGTPGELKLWNLATGEATATVDASRSVRWVAFSPDGKHLATAEHDNTAKLRDPASGIVLHELTGHESGLDTVVFAPDSATLATTSWDKTLKLWDSASGTLLKTFSGHSQQVYTAAFTPEGKELLSGSHDGMVKVWLVATASERMTVAAHDSVIHCVAFAPDGKRFATAGWDTTVRLWDAESGKRQMTLAGHREPVLAIAFSPDGKLLASVSGEWGDPKKKRPTEPGPGELKIWDTATGKEIATLIGHADRIFGVAFSPDGKTLATGSWDGTIKLWGSR